MSRLSNPVLRHLTALAALPELPGERYHLREPIGQGGMGIVYDAYDAALERSVAVKVTRYPHERALADRLRAEAQVLARLEHPGIVPVHDVGYLADGRLFYVMKRVQGETLRAHLRSLPERDRRLGVFERICQAVAFAHENGVVHRDLKPDNVMVGAFGAVVVLDWGVAKVLSEPDLHAAAPHTAPATGGTESGTVLGTPGFMAPEQARAAEIDRRADVFALGAILFQLLLDEAPPPEGDARALLRNRREIPRRLRAVCRRAMAPEPGDRYDDAGALAAEIVRFRAGLPVQAYQEGMFDRIERVIALYRTPILLVLAYLVMRVLFAVTVR